MTNTVDEDYPLTIRDKKAMLASDVAVRSFLVEEPTWTCPVALPDPTHDGPRTSAVFSNPFQQGIHEMVYLTGAQVGSPGVMTYLQRSPDSSTGWAEWQFEGLYSQVVATALPDGTVWLFALQGATVPGGTAYLVNFRLGAGGWGRGSVNQPVAQRALLYAGVGPEGAPRVWASGNVAVQGWIAFEVRPGTEAAWVVDPMPYGAVVTAIDWVVGYGRNGYPLVYSLAPNPADGGLQLLLTSLGGPQPATGVITDHIIALAGSYITEVDGLPVLDGAYFVTDGAQSLAMAFQSSSNVTPITTDQPWSRVNVHNDDQGRAILLGVPAAFDHQVQIARQTGTAPGPGILTVPTFEPFGKGTYGMTLTLATGMVSFAVDQAASGRLAMVTWGGAESARMHTHDLRFGWRAEPLTLPADIGLEFECLATHFVADAYVRDGMSAPLRMVPVGLSADIPIQVEVQGQQLVLGPDATVSTWTDALGKVTFRLPATALDTPLIHLSALGLGSGASVNLAECVQDFLGGDAAIAAVPTGLTAESLTTAVVNGTHLIDWDHSPLSSLQLVGECHRAFPRPDYEIPPPAGVRADRSGMQAMTSSSHSTDASQDDLLQSFRCEGTDIKDLSFVTQTDGTVVWIPSAETSLAVPLLLDAAEFSPRILECLFWWLGASTTDLLTWMTSTIDFTQMWYTVKALEELSLSTSQWQAAVAKYFGAQIKPGVFEEALGKLTAGLAEVRTQVAERSVPQLLLPTSDALTNPEQFHGPQGDALDLAELLDSPHARWIFERVLYSKAGSPPPDLPDTYNVLPDIEAILHEFSSGDLLDAFQAAMPDLMTPWNVTDPSGFYQDPATMGLSLMDSLVAPALSSCEEVLPAISRAVGKLNPVLTQLSVSPAGAGPELDAIFMWLQLRAKVPAGEVVPLTVARVAFLTAAIPINLACCRSMGAYPFPTGIAPAIPLPPNGSLSAERATADVEAGAFDSWTTTCLILQSISGATQVVWIWMNPFVDFSSIGFLTGIPGLRFFPSLPDSNRVTMLAFVGFEAFAFIGAANMVFWNYIFQPGWELTEALGWWLQYFIQSFWILVDAVLLLWGEKTALGKNAILAFEGKAGAAIVTTYSVVLIALAGWTFSVTEKAASDFLWLINRVAVYLPGSLAYLRYYVIEFMENQGESRVLHGRGLLAFNVKVRLTVLGNLVGAITELGYPLWEIANPPALPALTLPRGHANKPYEQNDPFKPTGGMQPYSGWVVVSGRVPNGTNLVPSEDGRTCVLAGSPTEVGSFSFEVAVTDYFAPAQTVTQTFKVNVTATEDSLI